MNEKSDQFDAADPHPIFSAIIDLYLLEMFMGVISSFTMYFMRIDFLELIFLLLGLVLLIITIIYHATFSNKIMWLSPGEIVSGRIIHNNEKVWTNPYRVNRFGLFFVCIFTILLFRNSDAIRGYLTSIPEILSFLFKTFIVTVSIMLIGKGKLIGITIINITLLIIFGLSMFLDFDVTRFTAYFSLGVFIVFTIIGVVYHKIRPTHINQE